MRRLPLILFWILLAGAVLFAFDRMMKHDEQVLCKRGVQEFCDV